MTKKFYAIGLIKRGYLQEKNAGNECPTSPSNDKEIYFDPSTAAKNILNNLKSMNGAIRVNRTNRLILR